MDRKIGVHHTTIANELIRGKVDQVKTFLAYFIEKFQTADYVTDVAVGLAKIDGHFLPSEMICTTTLYKYIDVQLLEIRNIDLQCKVGRKIVKKRLRTDKKMLVQSIEERPKHIENREEFGLFEIDTVIGKPGG